jgi:hypothetical protein
MMGNILLTNKEIVGTNVGTVSPRNNKAPIYGALSANSGGGTVLPMPVYRLLKKTIKRTINTP